MRVCFSVLAIFMSTDIGTVSKLALYPIKLGGRNVLEIYRRKYLSKHALSMHKIP